MNKLRVLDLFAGAGGFTVAGELADGYEWGGGESEICGVDDGVPKGSYRHRNGIMGNAIVPQVFAMPMRALWDAHFASVA